MTSSINVERLAYNWTTGITSLFLWIFVGEGGGGGRVILTLLPHWPVSGFGYIQIRKFGEHSVLNH